jgi:prevent-host-death family protein
VFTLTTAAARRKFSELVNRVWYTKERAVLTRYGRELVAIVPVEDLKRLEPRRKGRSSTPARKPAKVGRRTGRPSQK